MCVCFQEHMNAMAHAWRSEDSFQKSVSDFPLSELLVLPSGGHPYTEALLFIKQTFKMDELYGMQNQ